MIHIRGIGHEQHGPCGIFGQETLHLGSSQCGDTGSLTWDLFGRELGAASVYAAEHNIYSSVCFLVIAGALGETAF